MFTTAADSLSTLDQKIFGHWRAYFSLKSKFYMSQAFNYQGEGLLSQDKCGEAIRSLKESEKGKDRHGSGRPRLIRRKKYIEFSKISTPWYLVSNN